MGPACRQMNTRAEAILERSPDSKETGAYYTPPPVVDWLVKWAVRQLPGSAAVLDPSCGDGRFLDGITRAVGVDVDPDAISVASARSRSAQLIRADFFDWARTTNRRFDAVVGNPPFVRYQRFKGPQRENALSYCEEHGIHLSGLSSSWAPFVVGASTLLKPGGRLAMVVPAEIGYAIYARPVLDYLLRSFGSVQVFAVRAKLFSHLSEDTWLVRASGYGRRARLLRFSTTERFAGRSSKWSRENLPVSRIREGSYRLRKYLLPSRVRGVYESLTENGASRPLGDLADLGIGYVTGANEFFHLRPSDQESWQLPNSVLRPAIRTSRYLTGQDVSRTTVKTWHREDKPYLLLDTSRVDSPPAAVRRYLDSPAGLHARQSYKCRTREPWYQVPDVRVPDAFLTIMSSRQPKLVGNSAKCVCTNSLLAVRLRPGQSIKELLGAWNSPLTRLSCEIEGHPLGGGVLKLEPEEARSTAIPRSASAIEPYLDELTLGIETMRAWRHTSA